MMKPQMGQWQREQGTQICMVLISHHQVENLLSSILFPSQGKFGQ